MSGLVYYPEGPKHCVPASKERAFVCVSKKSLLFGREFVDLKEFMQSLVEATQDIPQSSQGRIEVGFASEEDGCFSDTEIKIRYWRDETDDEWKNRLAEIEVRQATSGMSFERRVYEQLKKKFEGA